jgi:hypothetical protein
LSSGKLPFPVEATDVLFQRAKKRNPRVVDIASKGDGEMSLSEGGVLEDKLDRQIRALAPDVLEMGRPGVVTTVVYVLTFSLYF